MVGSQHCGFDAPGAVLEASQLLTHLGSRSVMAKTISGRAGAGRVVSGRVADVPARIYAGLGTLHDGGRPRPVMRRGGSSKVHACGTRLPEGNAIRAQTIDDIAMQVPWPEAKTRRFGKACTAEKL